MFGEIIGELASLCTDNIGPSIPNSVSVYKNNESLFSNKIPRLSFIMKIQFEIHLNDYLILVATVESVQTNIVSFRFGKSAEKVIRVLDAAYGMRGWDLCGNYGCQRLKEQPGWAPRRGEWREKVEYLISLRRCDNRIKSAGLSPPSCCLVEFFSSLSNNFFLTH